MARILDPETEQTRTTSKDLGGVSQSIPSGPKSDQHVKQPGASVEWAHWSAAEEPMDYKNIPRVCKVRKLQACVHDKTLRGRHGQSQEVAIEMRQTTSIPFG